MPVNTEFWNGLTSSPVPPTKFIIDRKGKVVPQKRSEGVYDDDGEREPVYNSPIKDHSSGYFHITSKIKEYINGWTQSEQETSECSQLARLPSDVLHLVISNLDQDSLLRMSEVSKKYHHFCRTENRHWLQLFHHSFGKKKMLTANQSLSCYELYRDHYKLKQRQMTGKVQVKYLKGHIGTVYCITLFNGRLVSGGRDCTIRIWDIATGECIDTKEGPDYHQGSILRFKSYPDKLISSSADGSAIVWSKDFTPLFNLKGHAGKVLDACQTNDYFVTSTSKKSLHLWESNGDPLHRIAPCNAIVNSVEVQKNILVLASSDSKIRRYDLQKSIFLKEIDTYNRGSTCVFIRDMHILVGGADRLIQMWNTETNSCDNVFSGHAGIVRSMTVIDGLLFSGSYDKTLRVWDISNGRCLSIFEHEDPTEVTSLVAEGAHLFSAGFNGTITHFNYGYDLPTFL